LGGSNDKDHPPFEIIEARCWFSNSVKLEDFIKKEDANFYQDIELCMMKAAE
jgi:hypothetical protein